MTRRGAGLVAVAVVVLVLVGLGVWRRHVLVDERASAMADRERAHSLLRATRHALERTVAHAGAVEDTNLAARTEAGGLRTLADAVVTQILAVQQERDDAALTAVVANGQVGTLRTCLDGINRALNQVSVGDPGAASTLTSVQTACRAVS
jgi:hypothetical protein